MADTVISSPYECQEARAQSILDRPIFRLPIFSNNKQLAFARTVITGGTNGIHTLLNGGNQIEVLINWNLQRFEFHEVVCMSARKLAGAGTHLFCAQGSPC